MITILFLLFAALAALALFLFSQRKGSDSQHPGQDLPQQTPVKEKRTGDLD